MLEDPFSRPFAEAGAGAEEQGADGGFGAVEDGGDFGDAEFVDGGEQQGVALGLGEALDFPKRRRDLAGVGEGLVGGGGAGNEGLGEGFVELVGADAAAAVDGQVPGDADQPDAQVADCRQFEAVFENAEKDVLNNVFGLGAVAKDGVGDAEEQRGVSLDEGGQVRLRLCFRGDKRHVPKPFPVAGQLQPTARRHV